MFVERRMAPGESLFERTPPGTAEEARKPFCLCRRGSDTEHQSGRGGRNAHSPSHCIAHDNVDDASVFPSVDTTLEHIRSPEGAKSLLDVAALGRSVWSSDSAPQGAGDPREDLLDGSDRPRRRASPGFQPVSTQAQLDKFAYFFPDDHLAEARPEVQPQWPTPSGLTWSKALELCRLALANSTVGAVCGGLLGRRLDQAVELCVLDLQLKDEPGWVEALLPYLENECERRLLENGTRRSPQGPDPEVATALRCPNHCHGNGECTEGGCQCSSGYSFYDCSRAVSECPEP